jgi:ubiquinone/menaquinone biosynthesis C-methylase UbiE
VNHEPHEEPHKFDPARAHKLEDPERQRFLPNSRIVELLGLQGDETVVDYGAGSGVMTVEMARALGDGVVYAVEESPRMAELLRQRLGDSGANNVRSLEIQDNQVPLPDGTADRVLAVNLLHEVVGETALAEMLRLLAPDGSALFVDWRADVERDEGPPAEVTFDLSGAQNVLEEAGFTAEPVAEGEFPYHFAFTATVFTATRRD